MGTHITIFEAIAVGGIVITGYVFCKTIYQVYFKNPKSK
jgi:hypothetical protein